MRLRRPAADVHVPCTATVHRPVTGPTPAIVCSCDPVRALTLDLRRGDAAHAAHLEDIHGHRPTPRPQR